MNQETTLTLQAIDRSIKQSKALVELGQSLERLRSNKDFKKVILDGYLQDEAVRLVHLKADTNMQSADLQRSILTQIDAIGSMSQFLTTIKQKETTAINSMASDEAMREEMLLEDVGNE